MSKLPRLTGKAVIAALKRAGFEIVRVRGSHHCLAHADGRTTVVQFMPQKPSAREREGQAVETDTSDARNASCVVIRHARHAPP